MFIIKNVSIEDFHTSVHKIKIVLRIQRATMLNIFWTFFHWAYLGLENIAGEGCPAQAHIDEGSVGAETQAALQPPSSVSCGGPLYPKELPAPNSHTTPELLLNEWTLDPWEKLWKTEGKREKRERLRARGEGGDRGWDGWMASLTQWTWVWANSGR